jgi:hypothetical protein
LSAEIDKKVNNKRGENSASSKEASKAALDTLMDPIIKSFYDGEYLKAGGPLELMKSVNLAVQSYGNLDGEDLGPCKAEVMLAFQNDKAIYSLTGLLKSRRKSR